MLKIHCFFFLLSLSVACSQPKDNMPTANLIEVPQSTNLDSIVDLAAYVVPTQRQYDWQQLEFTAFLHFGMNTFTGREWGTGKEKPTQFNPTDLNVKQWIQVIKSANMKLAMLTAKHHDGFCLWQTQTTEHSVKNSTWKDGKGDVLREVVEAAKAEDIKVGVYLSPADLHEIERKGGTYGNGSKQRIQKIPSNAELQAKADTVFSYFLDDYDALFMNQLYEVLTQYGEISEVWFDGANPKPGTGQTYNTEAWYDMIRYLQPNAVIAIKGPDVRWVGNEAGKSRKNEWSVLPFPCKPKQCDWADARAEDLGSREKLKDAKYLYWYPAETDTPIRAGWFYRDEKQHVRPVEELLDVWYRSVGNNSVLLLNISPDRQGHIPTKDAAYMAKLGEILKKSFDKNLLEDAKITASNTERGKRIDAVKSKELTESWKTENGSTEAKITVDFDKTVSFNRVVLQEDIKNYGQRIEKFVVKIWTDNNWEQIYEGGTIGFKKIVRFPMHRTKKMQIHITHSRVSPSLGFVGVYKAPEMLSSPVISRDKNGLVSISCKTPDPIIYYTLDGTKPSIKSNQYTGGFSLPEGGVVKAVAVVNGGKEISEVAENEYDICKKEWVARASSEVAGYEADKAIDGNEKTLWHTPWKEKNISFPHKLTVDLGSAIEIQGFTYLPRQDGRTEGICTRYRVEGSVDGKKWKLLAQGTFDNIENNPVKQEVRFQKQHVKYLRFIGLKSVGNKNFLSVAELGVLTH